MLPGRTRLLPLAFVAVSFAAVLLRLWLAWAAPSSVDLANYARDVAVLRSGAPLYQTATNYNYSPVWAWLLELADAIARRTGWGLTPIVRTGLLATDLGCAALLFVLMRERGPIRQWGTVALYLVNPVGIWVSAVQGQFDVLALFFLLGAIQSVQRRTDEEGSLLPPMFLLTLSMAAKQITVFHPILFTRRHRHAWWLLLPYLATAALFLPYAHQWRAIRDRVLLYRSVPRSYGFSEFVLYETRAALVVWLAAVLAALTAAYVLRRQALDRSCLILFLVMLFFAPGLGAQYLVWPLAIGALRPGVGYFVFTSASILWVLGSHFGLPGSLQFMGQLVWLSVALWLVREIQALRRDHGRDLAVSSNPPAA